MKFLKFYYKVVKRGISQGRLNFWARFGSAVGLSGSRDWFAP
jgi:hypothetical protein